MNQEHLEVLASDGWRGYLGETILPAALRGVDLGDDVLEIGPGPGLTTDVLSRLTTRVTAVELDEELASALAERMSGTNVDVVHADATALPQSTGRFSAAVSLTMLHHVPTAELQDRIFAEVARVLRPAGVFAVYDSAGSEQLAAFHEGDTYNPVDPATVGTRLAAAGFAAVDVGVHDFGWTARALMPPDALDGPAGL